MKVDYNDSRITETRGADSPLQQDETTDNDSFLSLSFIHIRDEKVEQAVYRICRLLGRHGDVAVVLDYLLEQTRSASLCNEGLILLRQTLKGVGERKEAGKEAEVVSSVIMVVEELMDEEKEVTKDRVLHSCLLMGVVRECARVLGKPLVIISSILYH